MSDEDSSERELGAEADGLQRGRASPSPIREFGRVLSRRISRLERTYSIEPLGSKEQGEAELLSPEAQALVPHPT